MRQARIPGMTLGGERHVCMSRPAENGLKNLHQSLRKGLAPFLEYHAFCTIFEALLVPKWLAFKGFATFGGPKRLRAKNNCMGIKWSGNNFGKSFWSPTGTPVGPILAQAAWALCGGV